MVCLQTKLLVHQRCPAIGAEEAELVPVLTLAREVLVVNTDELSTLCTAVGKVTLITFYTEGIVFFQDISVASQTFLTVVTEQTGHISCSFRL